MGECKTTFLLEEEKERVRNERKLSLPTQNVGFEGKGMPIRAIGADILEANFSHANVLTPSHALPKPLLLWSLSD